LGDFYCLAPGVSLSREAIVACLRTIDSWPPLDRWNPPLINEAYAHACEQQAAAILLADFEARQLPTEGYVHVGDPISRDLRARDLTVLHSHRPWVLILRQVLPPELAREIRRNWDVLGLNPFQKMSRLQSISLCLPRAMGYQLIRLFQSLPRTMRQQIRRVVNRPGRNP
jgi:hypothetical protein